MNEICNCYESLDSTSTGDYFYYQCSYPYCPYCEPRCPICGRPLRTQPYYPYPNPYPIYPWYYESPVWTGTDTPTWTEDFTSTR